MAGGFTYDSVLQENGSPSKPTQPVTTKRWSTKAKAADHYMKPSSPQKTKSPIRARKSFTKSPTERKQIPVYPKAEPSYAAPAAP
jgi:hypothetical protein